MTRCVAVHVARGAKLCVRARSRPSLTSPLAPAQNIAAMFAAKKKKKKTKVEGESRAPRSQAAARAGRGRAPPSPRPREKGRRLHAGNAAALQPLARV